MNGEPGCGSSTCGPNAAAWASAALMECVLDHARQDHLGLVMLETQNTNVNAIRFYRRIGFSLEAIDIGHYYPTSNPVVRQQVQFLMKRWLE
jgi:ribosomal protein S18 acetylase RimI-like enzyme